MKYNLLEISLIAITMLCSIIGFFLVRYVKRKDKQDGDVVGKLKEQDDRALRQAERVEKVAKEMSSYVLKMQEVGVRFEHQVNQEIALIRRETSEIKNLTLEVKSSCNAISDGLNTIKKEMNILYETVLAHARSLSRGAETIHRHDQEISTIYSKLKFSDKTLDGKKD